ncbi:MAG: chemotaxis protein CheX [Proteobacteria bacterium]|nr:chemotaxis protein CheX [Desulfobulbaceae bacterium]MBU4153180.1 chemotaxis protein CheX [Pseudomonadota bacterium]MDP2105616.1 chemotaxis protein CheX [Desulfobulbaceae bacterium]
MISDVFKKELNAAAVEVFGTMYFTPVELLPEMPARDSWRLEASYIKSVIGYEGPSQATLCFYFPRSLGVSIASGFLGLEEEAITDQQLVDTMQESANMIVGNFLGRIDPSGVCRLGIPGAELVKSFSPDSACNPEEDLLAFVSDFGLLWLVCSVQQ